MKSSTLTDENIETALMKILSSNRLANAFIPT